jgi:hypothetical protein
MRINSFTPFLRVLSRVLAGLMNFRPFGVFLYFNYREASQRVPSGSGWRSRPRWIDVSWSQTSMTGALQRNIK